jgi:hypothetical protein
MSELQDLLRTKDAREAKAARAEKSGKSKPGV